MNEYSFLSLSFIIFFALLITMAFGKYIGEVLLTKTNKKPTTGMGHVEGAIFTVLGLLVAFTFYGASQRFDLRREMIINEANAISTSWLRIDVLPEQDQTSMRKLFTNYAKARLGVSQSSSDLKIALQHAEQGKTLQTEIWNLANTSLKASHSSTAALLFLPALNEMFDLENSHNMAMITHPPFTIFLTLIFMLYISGFFIGFSLAGTKRVIWLHGVGYALIMVCVLYVTMDFEYPRAGLISIEKYDIPLIELNKQFQKATHG